MQYLHIDLENVLNVWTRLTISHLGGKVRATVFTKILIFEIWSQNIYWLM
jgi:hypothetical protein